MQALSLGLPAKLYSDGFDPILLKWPTAFTNSDRIGGTIILDGQIGGGVDLMQYLNKTGPLSVFRRWRFCGELCASKATDSGKFLVD